MRILSIILGVFILIVFFTGGARYANYAASYALYPVLYAQSGISNTLNNWLAEKQNKKSMQERLHTMHQQYEQLLNELVAVRSAQQYVDATREVRKYQERYRVKDACTAHVLAKSFTEQSHMAYVNAGANKGIRKDMVVLHGNCLVGKITEVYPWYSTMVFISDRSCKVAAFCSQTRTKGIHEGVQQLDGSMLNFVSHLDEVKPQELILSSGEGMVFPHGLGLGRVRTQHVQGLLKNVVVEPLVDLQKIEYCTIVGKEAMS